MFDCLAFNLSALLPGNWTMENAKSMLHGWMNSKRIKAEYKYSSTGPSHNQSFIAEMGFYVNELKYVYPQLYK